MEKIMHVDGKDIRLVSSGATPIFYRNAFGRDYMEDLGLMVSAASEMDGAEEGSEMAAMSKFFEDGTITVIYNFAWVFAKNGNQDIKPLDEWLAEFEEFPLLDVFEDIMDMIQNSLTSKKV